MRRRSKFQRFLSLEMFFICGVAVTGIVQYFN